MTLMLELAEPFPFTEVSRGDLLDEMLADLDSTRGRSDRAKWAVMAGGEVR